MQPTSRARTALMRAVKQSNTAPEMRVRRYLHANGLRYRLHARELPGSPDILLPRFRTAVFVHGCFWHGHTCKHGAVAARTNADFWAAKISGNRARDRRKARALRKAGWRVLTIWECQAPRQADLERLLAAIHRPFAGARESR